ncbi:MAG TPA: MraY family glycosyltransferase [Patescibacteria group bacterium]|nr:MraY family glycosyltransferase [Patescibacteria group bacterium]
MIVLAFFISFILTFLATYPTIKYAKKGGLVDDSTARWHPAHTHTGIIPRAGGIPIYIGILLTALILLPRNQIVTGILIAGFFIIVMGLIDDYADVSPYLRFILNILIAGFVILFGLGIPYVSNPFGDVIRLDSVVWKINFFGEHSFLVFSNIVAIIWITAVMNFVNWSKGVDGQMPGFVVIASIFLGFLSFRFVGHNISKEAVILLSFITAGAFAGFLPHNFYPQKIMPGYGGGALAGFFLAVLSILSFGKFGTLILLLSIPFIDAIYVIARRIKNRQSPFRADAGHFHHRLLEIGWGKRRIAFFYWIMTLLFGIASLFFHGIQKVLGIIAVCILLAFFIVITNRIKKMKNI